MLTMAWLWHAACNREGRAKQTGFGNKKIRRKKMKGIMVSDQVKSQIQKNIGEKKMKGILISDQSDQVKSEIQKNIGEKK